MRQGVFEGPLTGAAYWFIAVAGVPYDIVMLHMQVDLIWQFFVHTKFITKMPPWFEYIFNTPSHHRVHHATNPIYIDKNYGGMLIIWDRIFGTFQKEQEEVVYGVVRPLKTWSPLYANFHYLYDVFRAAWNRYRKTSLSSALNYLFRGPGWQPGQTPQSKMEVLEKFWEKRKGFRHDPDRHLSLMCKIYLGLQTGFMILSLLAMTGKAIDSFQKAIITALMMVCMFAIGRIMDANNVQNLGYELLRTSLTSFAIFYLGANSLSLIYGASSLILLLLSSYLDNDQVKNK